MPPHDEWLLGYEGFDPVEEGTREALLTLGNGYLMTRGSAAEADADGIHYPGTYVAGVYNRLVSHTDGHTRVDESLVNLPNWLPFTFRPVNGPWHSSTAYHLLHHHVAIDLRRGIYLRDLLVRDPQNRCTRIREERLVSLERPHLACMRTTITPHDWSGPLEIRTMLDGRVTNANVAEFGALAKHHLTPPTTGHDGDAYWLLTATNQSAIRIAEAARTTLHQRGRPIAADGHPLSGNGYVGHDFHLTITPDTPVTADKIVAVYTSRDRAISEPLEAALTDIADAPAFTVLRARHTLAEQLSRLVDERS